MNRPLSNINASRCGLWSRVRARVAHAFTLRVQSGDLEERDRILLDRVARGLVDRGLASPAILVVESLAPLSFLGSQLVHALTPVLEAVASPRDIEQLTRLLERRETPSLLVERLHWFDEAAKPSSGRADDRREEEAKG